jgi:hypothetical protein
MEEPKFQINKDGKLRMTAILPLERYNASYGLFVFRYNGLELQLHFTRDTAHFRPEAIEGAEYVIEGILTGTLGFYTSSLVFAPVRCEQGV